MPIVFDRDTTTSEFRLLVEGQDERRLPLLRGPELRDWHRRYAGAFTPLAGEPPDPAGHNLTPATLADALLEYDRHGQLGGRQWMEEHLTDEEISFILQRIQAAHA